MLSSWAGSCDIAGAVCLHAQVTEVYNVLLMLFDLLAFPRDVQGLRHIIIDKLENQEPWPPACPPLEPTR